MRASRFSSGASAAGRRAISTVEDGDRSNDGWRMSLARGCHTASDGSAARLVPGSDGDRLRDSPPVRSVLGLVRRRRGPRPRGVRRRRRRHTAVLRRRRGQRRGATSADPTSDDAVDDLIDLWRDIGGDGAAGDRGGVGRRMLTTSSWRGRATTRRRSSPAPSPPSARPSRSPSGWPPTATSIRAR